MCKLTKKSKAACVGIQCDVYSQTEPEVNKKWAQGFQNKAPCGKIAAQTPFSFFHPNWTPLELESLSLSINSFHQFVSVRWYV